MRVDFASGMGYSVDWPGYRASESPDLPWYMRRVLVRAKVNGTELFFDVEGSGLVPDGPTMRERPVCLVLHGGPGMDHTYYRPWLSPLAEHLQLVYVDHRGNGRSQRMADPEYTVENMADDLEQLRIYLGIENPIILGNSFGGFVAQVYATRYPGRYSHLVLIATAPSYGFFEEATAIAEARATAEQKQTMPLLFMGKVLTEDDFKAWWDVMLPLYFHHYNPVVGRAMMGRTTGNPAIARYMFEQVIPHYDMRSQLGTITAPTLIIAGRHDWITPPSQNEAIHTLIPGSEYVVFEQSGHMPFVEEQEGFLSVVRRFLGVDAAG
jgi:proline iminopeptidase